jgi:hypothetical protein
MSPKLNLELIELQSHVPFYSDSDSEDEEENQHQVEGDFRFLNMIFLLEQIIDASIVLANTEATNNAAR